MSQLKTLYGYPFYPSYQALNNVNKLWLNHIATLQKNGFSIEPFCLTISPPAEAIPFTLLDRMWKTGNRSLMEFYEKLEYALEGKDCLLNSTGLNLHPEFVEQLKVFTVFQFNDDPESSSNLSELMAPAYDLCLVGNIAEVETYKSWGVKNAEWMPIGLQPHLYNNKFSKEDVFTRVRDIDCFMMIDKLAKWRKDRVEKIDKAFPNGHFYGRGWKRGFLPAEKELEYLLRSKISPNIHNSTGPINYRTFYTPANGVLLICDNKKYLSKIYELGKEAVGFDSIEEGIDLIQYYLQNDDERRWIAENGWKRAINDYSEVAVFNRTIKTIEKYFDSKERNNSSDNTQIIINYTNSNKVKFWLSKWSFFAKDIYFQIRKFLSRIKKRLQKSFS